jgi:hypothetical protein
MEYGDPVELTTAVLTRIGAIEIQTVKIRSLAHYQVHAVKYRDRDGQRQLAFCALRQEETGLWRCDRLTFVPSYQNMIHSNEEPHFFLATARIPPFLYAWRLRL